jgi:hypothetical protein
MANKRKHEARNQAHVMIEGQPTIDAILQGQSNRGGEMSDLPENSPVRQSDTLLQARCAGGVLDEGELICLNGMICFRPWLRR